MLLAAALGGDPTSVRQLPAWLALLQPLMLLLLL
jgi:hypothetical protein